MRVSFFDGYRTLRLQSRRVVRSVGESGGRQTRYEQHTELRREREESRSGKPSKAYRSEHYSGVTKAYNTYVMSGQENEKVFLGKMPNPWDLYGKDCFTELVPMFDLLSAYGDSTPLLLRHLWLLHNAIVGSRRDLVANLLRPPKETESWGRSSR
jgi:hypothetical protein